LTAACLLLAGCSRERPAPVDAKALTPVALQVNWYAEAEFGG
jgi:hypothetical protein